MNILHHLHATVRKFAPACLLAALMLPRGYRRCPRPSALRTARREQPYRFSTWWCWPGAAKPPANPAGQNPMLYLPALLSSGGDAAQTAAHAAGGAVEIVAAKAQPSSAKLVIDTDPGVDDAVALSWLFTQRSSRSSFWAS